MSQLYTSQLTVNRLLTIFSLFPSATRPTRHLLAWFLIAQLALESAPSVRCLFRQFLSKQTDAALSRQIHKEVFFATLVSKAQSSKKSSALLKALQTLACEDGQAA